MSIIREGLRIFIISLKRKFKGIKKYKGNDEEICKQIINECFNGDYFHVSSGHFKQFYARDFGWTVDSLLSLGKKKQVLKTLEYVLDKYTCKGEITVALTSKGKPFNFPNFPSIDSVAYIFRSLRVANANKLVKKYKFFLETELSRVSSWINDEGILSPNIKFSGMRDYALRKSSCYDNTFLAVLSREADLLKLKNPLKQFNFKKILIKKFWNGTYFNNDIEDKSFASDANLYPFFLGIVKNKKMLKSIIKEIQKRELDYPFPLSYTDSREDKMIFIEFFVSNWERKYRWSMMAFVFIELLSKIDKQTARMHLRNYKNLIERHKNFLELYDCKGNPYKSLFYMADESLSWCANYLVLKKKLP